MANIWVLIRHPDKVGDKEGIYFGDTATITEFGRQQMTLVIARLKLLCPAVVTCSMFPRAVMLAEHIAAELGLGEPVQTGLLNEIDKPRFLIGLKRTDPLHQDVMQAIRDGWDADTVPEHLLRGEKIRSRSEVEHDLDRLFTMVEGFLPTHHAPAPEVMLSVSHAKTIAAIGQKILSKDGSLVGYYDMADRAFKVSTTSITILKRRPNRRTGELQWHIQTWNEESHTDIGFDEELRSIIKDVT